MARLLVLAALLTAFIILVGPWPLPSLAVDASPEGKEALRGAAALGADVGGASAGGPLRAGLGRREIAVPLGPERGVLLGGYGIRCGIRPTPSLAVDAGNPCCARALAIETSRGVAALLAADLLYVGVETRRRVLEALAADPGIPAERVMFTATHSHAAPGEFAGGPAETVAVGAFREEVVAAVVAALVGAARDAARDLAPATLSVARASVPELTRNRYWREDEEEHGIVVDADLTVLRVREPTAAPGGSPGRLRGVFAVYGAHATVLGPWKPLVSGDWPGAFSQALERAHPGLVALCAAGPVGSQAPRPPEVPRVAGEDDDDRDVRRARAMGEALAHAALAAGDGSPARGAALATRELPLPEVQFRLAPDWRASPLFVRWLYPTPASAPFSALRVGGEVFLGVPCEVSGEVSLGMKAAAARAAPGTRLTVTSFAGHYHGYVPPDRCYPRFRYENRLSLHGARHGAFLERIASAVAGKRD